MLDEKHITAIEYLLDGTMLKSEIADRVGISTRTLSRWENDEEFKAELDQCRQQSRKSSKDKIVGVIPKCIDNMIDLANNSSDIRVKFQANKYLIDQGLGSPSAAKEEVNTPNGKENPDTNVLKKEIEDIKNLTLVK